MANNSQEKRVLCVGKVHDNFVSLRMAPRPVSEKEILTDKEMAAELEDLRDDMDDRAFWSRGGWQ